MSEVRSQEVEWRTRIQAAKNEPVVETFVLLLNAQLERLKTSALKCSKDDLERMQGEAAGYARVLKWINEPMGV